MEEPLRSVISGLLRLVRFLRGLHKSLAFRVEPELPTSREPSKGEKGEDGDCHCIQHPRCMHLSELLLSGEYILSLVVHRVTGGK